MNIYLVRHGQTQFNATGLLQGWADSPLTEEGKQIVAQTGQLFAAAHIHFNRAFCSTSPRTLTTAELILQHAGQPEMQIWPLADLREYHFGSFEGKPAYDLHELIVHERGYDNVDAWLHAYRHGSHHLLAEIVSQIDPEQRAEDETRFITRLQTGLQQVIGASLPNDNVLVVSHGMAIAAILKAIAPQTNLYKSLPNASVSLLQFDVFDGLQLLGEAGRFFEQG